MTQGERLVGNKQFDSSPTKGKPSLKRRSAVPEIIKLSVRCTEWTLHAVESHMFSVRNVTYLAIALLTGGRGPLIKTSAPQEQCSKDQFYLNISDCWFTMSFAMVCKIFEILLISFADTIPISIQYKFNSLMSNHKSHN